MMIKKNKLFLFGCVPTFLLLSTACTFTPNWLNTSGPSRAVVTEASNGNSGIKVIDIDGDITQRLLGSQHKDQFSQFFANKVRDIVVGSGDVLEVSIWEAPPALLFSSSSLDSAGASSSRETKLTEQMVASNGFISIPFAGQVKAEGRSTAQIEAEITGRLKGKANQPQVLVKVVKNNTSNVTVVGEVANNVRMPLTSKGERLLDALAAAGGSRQPVNKTTVQITRGSQFKSLALQNVINDPSQNIRLQAGDVVTLMFQPLSYTVLGAVGRNEEINFEAQGISLTQALARAGGLQDSRADAKGVFIFRYEDATLFNPDATANDKKVPVIYRLNLRDPAMFFVAQKFPVYNKDVLYVSNAPAAELSKFLNILTSSVYTINGIRSIAP